MRSMGSTELDFSAVGLLKAYPFPAFVIDSRKAAGKLGVSIEPIWFNASYLEFVGVRHDGSSLQQGQQPTGGLLSCFPCVEDGNRFLSWLNENSDDSITLEGVPAWAMDDHLIDFTVAKTAIDNYVVLTFTFLPSSPTESNPRRNSNPRKDRGMKLSDLSNLSTGPITTKITRPHTIDKPLLVGNQDKDSDMTQLIQDFDWPSTGLPDISEWPQSLRSTLSFVLASPHPKSIWWGPDLVLMYNNAYATMSGIKHPGILGLKGRESWKELWEHLGPYARRVMEDGEAVAKTEDLLFMHKLTDKFLQEETYHNWSWIPVWKEDNTVGGMLNTNFETTQKVLSERRLNALRDLGERSAACKNETEYVAVLMDVLSKINVDAPFAAFYFSSYDWDENNTSGGIAKDKMPMMTDIQLKLTLAKSMGLDSDNPYIPSELNLVVPFFTFRPQDAESARFPTLPTTQATSSSPLPISSAMNGPRTLFPNSSGSVSDQSTVRPTLPEASSNHTSATSITVSSFEWPFNDCFVKRKAVLVSDIPASLSSPKRGWGDRVRDALVMPIFSENQDRPVAVLIVGCNSRRPYDSDYATWIDILRSSVGNSLTAASVRRGEIQRAQELLSLDAAKTTFFSNASHELRTPLTLIAGPLEDAIDQAQDQKVKHSLMLARRNVSRLSRMVDVLMDFSRLEAGRLQGQYKPVNLGAYTKDLASLFRATIERNSIELAIDCEDGGHRVCYVDPDFWEKICFNLIGNAFKYTMSGKIDVCVRYETEQVVLSVKDTGVGIPAADIQRLGERFHRVKNVGRSHEGTGIGLSLTKELVKLHGGSMDIQSVTSDESVNGSHGSTFWVQIPLGKAHLSHLALREETDDESFACGKYGLSIIEEASQWGNVSLADTTPSEYSDPGSGSGSGSGGSGNDSGSRMNHPFAFFSKSDVLLIVEDSAEMRRYLKSTFSPHCHVMEAPHGKAALEMIAQKRPDLVLTDQMMPYLDGHGLLTALKSNPQYRLIPVILLTAQAGDDSRVDGLLQGFDDYLVKPFKARELVARVSMQLQLGKRRRLLEAAFDEQTQEIKLLSEKSPVGIFRTDSNGSIIYVNPQWHELSGHGEEELDTWISSVHSDDVMIMQELWHMASQEHQQGSLEFRWKNDKWAKAQLEPLKSVTGDFIGVLGTFTDISDRRMFEASQLAHAKEMEHFARKRAEEAEQRRNEADERRRGQELLIDVTSHELRQPVSAIINCAALIRSNIISLREELSTCQAKASSFVPTKEILDVMDQDLEALDAIYQCGLAQERIANDVLSLSRIQLNVLSIHPVEFELAPEVKRILSVFKNELTMKHIRLIFSIGESLKQAQVNRVICDRARFAQVITNLLSNAIKFTDTSSYDKLIRVAVEVSFHPPTDKVSCTPPPVHPSHINSGEVSQPVYIYVSVQDSGPGLKPDDVARLFRRFAQGSNSHDVFGGSGLGLFVSRQLCDLMGGRIGVESVYEEGATFSFYIHAMTAANPPSGHNVADLGPTIVELTRDPSIRSPVNAHPPTNLKALHVLITEDNLINQTILSRQLIKEGLITTLASNGVQAIEEVKRRSGSGGRSSAKGESGDGKERRFDVILMDCEMPVMDGLTAVREIRRMEASGELEGRNRIYALTGNARDGQIESAKEAGMDDVIIKPYKINDLMKLLRHG